MKRFRICIVLLLVILISGCDSKTTDRKKISDDLLNELEDIYDKTEVLDHVKALYQAGYVYCLESSCEDGQEVTYKDLKSTLPIGVFEKYKIDLNTEGDELYPLFIYHDGANPSLDLQAIQSGAFQFIGVYPVGSNNSDQIRAIITISE